MLELLSRNWRWLALRGVVAILFGVVALFYPGMTLATLVLLFGAYALVDGVFTVVAAIANRHGEPRWAALLFGGLLGIAVGIVTFLMPEVTTFVLLALIAFWAIFTGVAEIVVAVRLRKVLTGEWMMILAGLLAVAFGLILVLAPGAGALALVMWIGAYAVLSGALLIGLGFRLRTWGREHGAMPHPA